MRDNLTKTRSYTYLLPGLASYVNIDRNKIKNLFLGIFNRTKTFNGNVYVYVENMTDYEKGEFWRSTNTYNGDTIIEYEYPDQEHYVKFVQGKYSEFSDESKQQILKYHSNASNFERVKKILCKHKSLKEEMERNLGCEINGELGEKIEFEDELYNDSDIN